MSAIVTGPGLVVGGGGAVTAASVVAALATTDPMAGSGWTTGSPSAGASASWTGGTLVLTAPTAADGAAIQVTNASLIPTPTRYQLGLRVTHTTGDGVAGANGQLVWSVGAQSSSRLQLQIKSNGAVQIYGYAINGSGEQIESALATGISAGQRTGGQLWYVLDVTPESVTLLFGVGVAGAFPTSLTAIKSWTDDDVVLSAQGSWCGLSVYTPTGVSGGYVLTLGAIRPVARA